MEVTCAKCLFVDDCPDANKLEEDEVSDCFTHCDEEDED